MEQSEYLDKLMEAGKILGEWDNNKVSGLTPQWFWDRQIGMLDFRGDLRIMSSENITFGFGVKILTASHDFSAGAIGNTEYKKCWIYDNVFVGSFSLLYNCVLERNVLVACGSVVRSMRVPEYCYVEGNPAKITRKYTGGRWKNITTLKK